MDITDIRRNNLRKWVAEHGRPSNEKSLFSQLLGSGSFGEKVARRLERDYKMEPGFLDRQFPTLHSTPEEDANENAEFLRQQFEIDRRNDIVGRRSTDLAIREGEVEIPQYDVAGSMGTGLILDGMAGVIRSWRVDHEWMRLNVRNHSGIGNLCIVTGFGPSMRPMFNPGDPLLMDRGVTTFDREDAVYFFRVGDHGYIKIVQRIPAPGGGMIYRAKSKNPDYDPFEITADMDFEVFGKILTVWKSEQF